MLNRRNSILLLFTLLVMLIPRTLLADRCPSPDIIKDRKISRQYAWLIDERRTLEDVLAVEKLYSVRIKNEGEFATCYYTTSKQLLEMDAKPLREGCTVIEYKGTWESVNRYEKVCAEEDVYQCQYAIYCDETDSE